MSGASVNMVRSVNNLLRKNRRILEAIWNWRPDLDEVQVEKHTLFSEGLHPEYFTGRFIDENGIQFKCCYEFAYGEINADSIVVVKLKSRLSSQSRINPDIIE